MNISWKGISFLLAILLLAGALAPRGVQAGPDWIIKQNETHGRWNLTPSITIVPWWYFAPGLRFGIPVAKSGFLPMVNDEVKLEIGFNYQFWWHIAWGGHNCSYYCDPGSSGYDAAACDSCTHDYYYFDAGHPLMRIGLPVVMHWEFFLTRRWSVYAGFGLEVGIPMYDWHTDPFGPHGWVWLVLSFGAKVQLASYFALRFEIGTIGFPMIGFEFMF